MKQSLFNTVHSMFFMLSIFFSFNSLWGVAAGSPMLIYKCSAYDARLRSAMRHVFAQGVAAESNSQAHKMCKKIMERLVSYETRGHYLTSEEGRAVKAYKVPVFGTIKAEEIV